MNNSFYFDESKIDRRTNLEKNDSLSSYEGMTCQQNPHCFDAFYQLIKDKNPSRILEIGTSLGGLTQYLKHICDGLGLDTNIRSYDIHGRHEYDKMVKNGIDVRIENIFSQDYNELIDNEVEEFIKSEGVTIVLCDGGNKIREFNFLSKYLKVGDIIMAHDYAYDREVFLNEIDKIYWNWHEISESDIKESVEKHNLKPFMQDLFTKAVWVCKIKE